MYLVLISYFIVCANASPVNMVQKVAENDFENFDNYLPKIGDFPKFHYTTQGENSVNGNEMLNVVDFKTTLKEDNPKSFGSVAEFMMESVAFWGKSTEIYSFFEGAAAGMDLLKEIKDMFMPTSKPETAETTTIPTPTTTETELTTLTLQEKFQLDPVLEDDGNTTMNRTIRQEDSKEEDMETNDNKTNKETEKESQEEDVEEEPENMITGLISAFLGGLSRPDGSVDVEAITGLLGSLSTQNDDGTYDFNGLTELLMSFFGGTGEEGGGSNFGAFIGGLLGAFIKGVASPPGAKGAGTFVGNILGGVLPGLSAPAPTEEGQPQKPQPPLDSGGFLGGLLSSVIGNLGSLSAGSSGGGDNTGGGGGNKFSLFKAIFQLITSIFSSSSTTH